MGENIIQNDSGVLHWVNCKIIGTVYKVYGIFFVVFFYLGGGVISIHDTRVSLVGLYRKQK